MPSVVPSIQQVFTCFAVVHALLNVYLFNPIVHWIRQISMATEAAESRWRALEDALGPSCDEGMHLSCKLNCASGLYQGPRQSFLDQCGIIISILAALRAIWMTVTQKFKCEVVKLDSVKKKITLKDTGILFLWKKNVIWFIYLFYVLHTYKIVSK